MSNEPLEHRIRERIKQLLPDVLNTEDTKKMVDDAMHQVFFAPTKIEVDSWTTKEGPPLLHTIIKEQLQAQVDEAVKTWMLLNQEKTEEALQTVIEQGLGNLMINTLNQHLHQDLFDFKVAVNDKLRQLNQEPIPTEY